MVLGTFIDQWAPMVILGCLFKIPTSRDFVIQWGGVGLRNPRKRGFWPKSPLWDLWIKRDKIQIPKEIPIYRDSDLESNLPEKLDGRWNQIMNLD